jgi:peptidoglycan/LPS O-acetylase OafA/YrhL
VAATSPEILVDQNGGSRDVIKGQVAALTGLRGFAALVVVVVHCSSLTAYPWVGFHSYGPIALFVLSGFLLFQPWSRWMIGERPRPSIKEFAWRRLWRIFPPYLALLALVTLVYPPSRPSGWEGWLRAITLTNIYDPDSLTRGLYHTWSLGTELSWYVVLPVASLWIGVAIAHSRASATRVLTAVAIVALVVGLVWRWMFVAVLDGTSLAPTSAYLFPAFAFCFAGGALVGHLKVLQNRTPTSPPQVMGWLARHPFLTLTFALSFGILGASELGGPWTFQTATLSQGTIRWTSMTFMALLLVAGVASASDQSIIRRIFSWRPMTAVGRWSYGIYLWHMPLLLLMHREIDFPRGVGGLLIWVATVIAVSIPFGAITYRFVELPAIAWSKRSGPARPSMSQNSV